MSDIIIERKWCMPSRHTFTIKPIKELLEEELTKGIWLDPFAGENSPVPIKYRNDLNPDIKAKYHMDAIEFLKQFEDGSVDGILHDPPYSFRQATECYKKFGRENLGNGGITNMKYWKLVKDEAARVIKPEGKAICFGWNSMGLGKNRGFKMKRVLLVPHGGSQNDTLVTVEVKRNG